MTTDNHEDSSLTYKLLKLELTMMCDAHKQLLLQLEHAKETILQLTIRLEDANNEITILRQCSRQDRRQINMPYSEQDRRQFNLAATQH